MALNRSKFLNSVAERANASTVGDAEAAAELAGAAARVGARLAELNVRARAAAQN